MYIYIYIHIYTYIYMYTCMNMCVYVYLCRISLALLFTYDTLPRDGYRVYTRSTHSHANTHKYARRTPRPRKDCAACNPSGLRTLHQSSMPRSVYWPWQVLCATVCGKQAYVTHLLRPCSQHLQSSAASTWFRAGLSIIVACFGSDFFCFDASAPIGNLALARKRENLVVWLKNS